MRRITAAIAFASLALTVGVPSSAQDFEGVVGQRTISLNLEGLESLGLEPDELFDLTSDEILALQSRLEWPEDLVVEQNEILIKGHLIRMDTSDEEGPAYALVDLEAGITRMVQPAEGVYLEITREDLEGMGMFAPEEERRGPEIVETGASRVINGMRTRGLVMATPEGEMRAWVTDDDPELMASFGALVGAMQGMAPDEAQDDWSVVISEYGVPVLTQTLDRETFVVEEITSLERRTVAADRFSTPAGLQRVTFADMMGAMEEAGMGAGHAPMGAEPVEVWVEYSVSGAVDWSAREVDVVMCSEISDGFAVHTIGDVIVSIEAAGMGDGVHDASISVSRYPESFEGRGTVTLESAGSGPMGFPLYDVRFEGRDLESEDGSTVDVDGTAMCALM